jgi:hypothetical protein
MYRRPGRPRGNGLFTVRKCQFFFNFLLWWLEVVRGGFRKGACKTSRSSCEEILYTGDLAPNVPEGPSGGLNKRPFFLCLRVVGYSAGHGDC